MQIDLEKIEGKITGIGDQGTVVIIYVQENMECRLICVRPELFDEIKKAVGDPVGKRFFTKDGHAYIQDQETTAKLSNLDFVIFPNK